MSVARWLLFTALVEMIGCVGVRWLLAGIDADEDDPRQALEERIARWGLIFAVLGVLGMLGLGVGQLLAFRDPFAPIRDEASLLFLRTDWGRTWFEGLTLLLLVTWLFAALRRRTGGGRPWWPPITLGVAVLAFFPSMTGHAVGSDRLTVLAVAADGLHVLAAGAWIGGLTLMLALFGPTGRGRARARVLLPALLPRFSNVAVASASTLMVTGLFAAWLHVPTWGALLDSGYGRLLVAKVVLVLVVAALGGLSWRAWTRRRRMDESLAMPSSAMVELLVAQAVLAVTAVLVATPFPMEGSP